MRLHVIQRTVFRRPFCPSVRLSVCLSVCQTRALWQNERNLCHILILHERTFILVFSTGRMVGGGRPACTWNFGPNWHRSGKKSQCSMDIRSWRLGRNT